MNFAKVRDVKLPKRNSSGDAGIDFFVPEVSEDFTRLLLNKNPDIVINGKTIAIRPHGSIMIPSGIHVRVPVDHALIAFNKSGIAGKQQLTVGACVIDNSYQGEVHINMINTSDKHQLIDFGSKLVQFILLPVWHCDIAETNITDLYINHESVRGSGAFGSTGL